MPSRDFHLENFKKKSQGSLGGQQKNKKMQNIQKLEYSEFVFSESSIQIEILIQSEICYWCSFEVSQ